MPLYESPFWMESDLTSSRKKLVSKLAAQKKWSEKQKNQFSTWLLATSIWIACFTHAGENMDIIINAYNFPLPKMDNNSLLSLMKIICHQSQKATPCGNRCSLFPTCFSFLQLLFSWTRLLIYCMIIFDSQLLTRHITKGWKVGGRKLHLCCPKSDKSTDDVLVLG